MGDRGLSLEGHLQRILPPAISGHQEVRNADTDEPRRERPSPGGPRSLYPSMDGFRRLDTDRLHDHGARGGSPCLGRRGQPVHRRHGRAVVRERRFRPPGADRCGDETARRPAAVLLFHQSREPPGDRAGREACRAGAGQPESRLLQHGRIGRQRHGGADRALLLRQPGPAVEAPHHLPPQLLSRQHVPGRGPVRQDGRQARIPVPRGTRSSRLGSQLLPDAGRGRRGSGVLRFSRGRVRAQSRGPGRGQRRVLLRRADHGGGRSPGRTRRLSPAHEGGVRGARHPLRVR